MRVSFQDIVRWALNVLKAACVLAIVVLMITYAREFVAAASIETEPPPVQPLEIQFELHDFNCGADGKVIEAIADVRVSGGEPPYQYETDPANLLYAEFQLPESGIRFRIEGGQTVILGIRSGTADGKPRITRDIYAPQYLVDCEAPVHTPTSTPTATSTPTPTSIDTPTPTPTLTSTSPFLSSATATEDSDDPRPTRTLAFTPTPTDELTTPDGPTPTDKPTSTDMPPATDEPTPQPTSTPRPTSTKKPTPTSPPPTPTPPPPNKAECEDGRDNDGDGYKDLQDPQCKSKNDNHEDK